MTHTLAERVTGWSWPRRRRPLPGRLTDSGGGGRRAASGQAPRRRTPLHRRYSSSHRIDSPTAVILMTMEAVIEPAL